MSALCVHVSQKQQFWVQKSSQMTFCIFKNSLNSDKLASKSKDKLASKSNIQVYMENWSSHHVLFVSDIDKALKSSIQDSFH